MKIYLLLLFTSVSSLISGQNILMYSAGNIPDSLKKNADAVYLHEEMDVTVLSSSRLIKKEHSVTAILTKKGLSHARVSFFSDKLTKLDDVEIKVFNSLGIEVGKYKKKDFKVEGLYDGITLASDDKVYELYFTPPELPFTIEKTSTVTQLGYINMPGWYFGSSNESFIISRYTLKTPADLKINYKVYNSDTKPVIATEGLLKIYKWELSNRPVPVKEPGSYGAQVHLCYLDINTETFSYDGYAGSMSSWQEFGKWSYPFYEEEKLFEPERISFLQQLVQPAKTEKEKIAILYKYLQQETRYVSIQFGIGGFKPFPVSFLEKKKYGDCKALTHYMKAMLQAVGIKSYAALINAGPNSYPVDPSFAMNRFNHVILCVPHTRDSFWLECTGKQTSPGVLGSFTENRNALLLTENGGVLVKTPVSNSSNNQWIAKTNTELFDDGSAVVRSRVFVSGEFWDYFFAYTNSKSKDDIHKALVNVFEYKAPDDFEFKILNDSANGHIITIDLVYNKFFDFKAGSKHFFPFRHYRLNDETIEPAETRKHEYLFQFPYSKIDSTVYKVPASFKNETLPVSKEIKNNFFVYKNDVQWNETEALLSVTTQLTLHKHIVPAKLFNEVATGFNAVKKDEAQKIILKKE